MAPVKIGLTGATGYVGGRLLPRLEASGHSIRCLARHPQRLKRKIGPATEVVEADVQDKTSLKKALEGLDCVFYLVHSLGQTTGFEEEEKKGAENFASIVREVGVKRIIYLGGLGAGESKLSPHLRSRQHVGDLLRESGVQVIEFRASIILGSGSLSFELVRSLVELLPIMITPKWVSSRSQPIGIEDVLQYLVKAVELPVQESTIYEIGGPDVVGYGELMREYARQRNLKRILIPVPFLTPFLSSLWLGLVTPLFARIGRKLIDSIKNDTIVRDSKALQVFPIKPLGVREAIAAALKGEEKTFDRTRWSDSLSSGNGIRSWAGVRFGTRRVDSRTTLAAASPSSAFRPIERIGGKTGWYYGDWLWGLRGLMDLLLGGVGIRRGRKSDALHVGDVVDCWRVEAIEENKRLRLHAEMKLPGRAWLEFEVEPAPGGCRIRQTAVFDPVGLSGFLYWYSIYPLHELVFQGMLDGIKKEAEWQEKKLK